MYIEITLLGASSERVRVEPALVGNEVKVILHEEPGNYIYARLSHKRAIELRDKLCEVLGDPVRETTQ